jgi:hypothetical protein
MMTLPIIHTNSLSGEAHADPAVQEQRRAEAQAQKAARKDAKAATHAALLEEHQRIKTWKQEERRAARSKGKSEWGPASSTSYRECVDMGGPRLMPVGSKSGPPMHPHPQLRPCSDPHMIHTELLAEHAANKKRNVGCHNHKAPHSHAWQTESQRPDRKPEDSHAWQHNIERRADMGQDFWDEEDRKRQLAKAVKTVQDDLKTELDKQAAKAACMPDWLSMEYHALSLAGPPPGTDTRESQRDDAALAASGMASSLATHDPNVLSHSEEGSMCMKK